MNRLLLIPAILLATAGPAAADDAKRTITIEEAMSIASGDSLAIDIGKEQIEALKEKKKATKALRLPTLGVKASVLVWNDTIDVTFMCTDPDPDNPPDLCPDGPFVTTTVREQVTGSAEVNVAQPLTGLLLLGRLIEGDDAAIDAAQADLQVAKLDAAYQAAEAYLGALQAQTLRELSATSVTQLEADLVKIRALRDANVLADVDVLRLEAARDQAQAGVLEAESATETALRGLALLLDLPDGTELAITPIDTTPPELPWTEDDAVALAKKQRPELRAAESRVEQAEVGVDAAKADYFPNVLAIGNYTHSEGQGFIATKDSAFVGITLDWNIWDWGRKGDNVRAARAQKRIAKRAREELDDQLAFDVRSKWLAASTKKKTLAVNQSALKAAEEAYRLQTVKIQGGIATATDVIDAEAEVSRARAAETIARYQYLTAWMALVRAVGQVPDMPGAK